MLRRRLVDDSHVAAAISKPRTNRNLARFPGPIRQYVRHWARRKRARRRDVEVSFCVTCGRAGHAAAIQLRLSSRRQAVKNSLSIASRRARRPETFPKTAIYCHLLPFWSRKTATPVATVSFVLAPRGHAGRPDISHWLWVISRWSSVLIPSVRRGWLGSTSERPRPRSEASSLGARWLWPTRPQPPRSDSPRILARWRIYAIEIPPR